MIRAISDKIVGAFVFSVLGPVFILSCSNEPDIVNARGGAPSLIEEKNPGSPSLLEIHLSPLNLKDATLADVAIGLDRGLKENGALALGFKGVKVETPSSRVIFQTFETNSKLTAGILLLIELRQRGVEWHYEEGWIYLYDMVEAATPYSSIGIDSPVFEGLDFESHRIQDQLKERLMTLTLRDFQFKEIEKGVKNGVVIMAMPTYDWQKLIAIDNMLRRANWSRDHPPEHGERQDEVRLIIPGTK